MGFMPGFIYLSGLPDKFHLPRLATPRLKVPAGAVAIADGLLREFIRSVLQADGIY